MSKVKSLLFNMLSRFVTPALLPGKPHGWRSLVGYSPWGCEESDTTERLHFISFVIASLARSKHLFNQEV